VNRHKYYRSAKILFGPRRDEVTREWTKLHDDEPNDLYCLPKYCSGDKIEKNEMGGACSAYGVVAYTGFWAGKPEGEETTCDTQA